MERARRRAVTACLADGATRSALAALGWDVVGRAADGPTALALLRSLQPDLAVLDAVLPGVDGAALIPRIRRLKLAVQPAALLVAPRGLRLPGADRLASLGASALEAPLSVQSLGRALEALMARPIPLPEEKSARLDALLDALGVPEHPGRSCLRLAIELTWADRRRLNALRDDLYPSVARLTGMAPAQVERAIRHVIDAAWRSGEIEQQHKIFGDTIDARRGKPTSGEMIAQLADILRWEGRQ